VGGETSDNPGTAPKGRRPRMPLNADNRFWYEAVQQGVLPIQRCVQCATLRHPPRPMCGICQSLDWDTVAACGRGRIYSYATQHRPAAPGFDQPFVILLVELEEGVRVIGNLSGSGPESVSIDLPVQVSFEADPGDDMILPRWRLATAAP
jgi:uncharacterized OB-fold protein